MTIKEVEEITGLQRSNIRFYEKEGLVTPKRNDKNGYREYTDKDVDYIKKIACLRTLGITIEDIRRIMQKEMSLHDTLGSQADVLKNQMDELNNAKNMCEAMLKEYNISFDNMVVEKYVPDLESQWKHSEKIFQMDTVGFIQLWGGSAVWMILTAAALIVAVLSFSSLPGQIPIQWNDGIASTLVDRKFIFVYPLACMASRHLLRPIVWRWLNIRGFCSDILTDYISNFICFVVLSVEIFTLLFLDGISKNVVMLLAADAVIFVGIMIIGWNKASGVKKR